MVCLLQVPKAKIKVLADLGSYLEVLGENPLPGSLRLLKEFSPSGRTEVPVSRWPLAG